MNNRTDHNAPKSSPRTKVKLDSSKVLGEPLEGRTVGGKKSGLTGKVHFDSSKVMTTRADGRTFGSAKSGSVGK